MCYFQLMTQFQPPQVRTEQFLDFFLCPRLMVSVHFLDHMWDSIVVHLVVGSAEKNCVTNHRNKNVLFTTTLQSHNGFTSEAQCHNGLNTSIQISPSCVKVWLIKSSLPAEGKLFMYSTYRKTQKMYLLKCTKIHVNTYISWHLANSSWK